MSDTMYPSEIAARMELDTYRHLATSSRGDGWDIALWDLVVNDNPMPAFTVSHAAVLAFARVLDDHTSDAEYTPEEFTEAFAERFKGEWNSPGEWLRWYTKEEISSTGDSIEAARAAMTVFKDLADWTDWEGKAKHPGATAGFVLHRLSPTWPTVYVFEDE